MFLSWTTNKGKVNKPGGREWREDALMDEISGSLDKRKIYENLRSIQQFKLETCKF
jgi:hypothetical protein